jgi:hypothetical protein
LAAIDKVAIGKIAERIVMNELEFGGYRATDLNKDGLSANADLIASKDGETWQIQVKGAFNGTSERWWIGYGHCNTDQIANQKSVVFNSKKGFYTASYVAFVAVRSPSAYRYYLMPVKEAEKAAQYNLGRYRLPKKDGEPKKPGKMWLNLEPTPREWTGEQYAKERAIFERWKDNRILAA